MLADAEIRDILTDRIDIQGRGLGMVVGVVATGGRRLICQGLRDYGDPRPVDGDTVFEIGSITKVFTSLLLADMVERGEVALTDPLAHYLPAGVKVPERNGRKITLIDLATHTSGLPSRPSDFPPLDDPAVASYSVEQLYRFLSERELQQDIGLHWAYSDLGQALLGHALAHRAGMAYEALIRERITRPLGMDSTTITVSPQMESRLAVGHDAEMKPVPNLEMPALVGAGALRSSANDLLTFVAASMGALESTLAPAMSKMLETRRPMAGLDGDQGKLVQAIGWWAVGQGGDLVVFHDGVCPGFTASVAFDPKIRFGVVVLSNTGASVGDIARHLMRPSLPLADARVAGVRREIAVGPELFDRYAGLYQPEPGVVMNVVREGDLLMMQLPMGGPKVRLRPESERSFFSTEIDFQVTFQTNGEERATRLTFRWMGQAEEGAERTAENS